VCTGSGFDDNLLKESQNRPTGALSCWPTVMFKKFIENKKLGGVNCLIWQDGHMLYQESEGFKNPEKKESLTIDTLFRIASMTKPITSALALMLYEEKKLDLNDPVIKWFPRFGKMKVLRTQTGEYEDACKEITILDLLTHRAGFTYGGFQKGKLKEDYLKVLGGDIDTEISIEQWVNGLASLPLVSQPGELFNYGKSTDLLGIIISVIEGKSLGRVMEEKIFISGESGGGRQEILFCGSRKSKWC